MLFVRALLYFMPVSNVAASAVSWFDSPGCIFEHNDLVFEEVFSMEHCKEICLARMGSLPCRSVDYDHKEAKCILSKTNRKTAGTSFQDHCFNTFTTYAEIEPTLWLDRSACIRVANDLSFYKMTSLEDCKRECEIRRVSLPCRSIDFRLITTRCFLSKSNRQSPVKYMEPCEQVGYVYAEVLPPGSVTWYDSHGCILDHNDLVFQNVSSMEDCKEICLTRMESLPCRSVDYNHVDLKCILSKTNRKMAGKSFQDPCSNCFTTYAEIEPTSCKSFKLAGELRVKDGSFLSEVTFCHDTRKQCTELCLQRYPVCTSFSVYGKECRISSGGPLSPFFVKHTGSLAFSITN